MDFHKLVRVVRKTLVGLSSLALSNTHRKLRERERERERELLNNCITLFHTFFLHS